MANATMKRKAKPPIPSPTSVGVDNFEAGCNAGLVLDVGAGKLVGLELLDTVIGMADPLEDDIIPVGEGREDVKLIPLEDDIVPVGEGKEDVKLIVAVAIVDGTFENI